MTETEGFSADPASPRGWQQRTRVFGLLVGGLAALAVLVWLLPLHHVELPRAWFLPVHVIVELVAIITSFLIFSTGWIAWRRSAQFNSLLLACAFLGVGLLDVSHILTYEGMGLFPQLDPAETATRFWLAARALAASGLLLAVVLPERLPSQPHPLLLLFWTVALVAVCHWLVFSGASWLPAGFADTQGSTGFKAGAEYSLALINLLSATIVFRRLQRQGSHRHYHLHAMWAALVIMALSSALSAQYDSMTDLPIMLGHGYKALAYLLLFRALFVEIVDLPYLRVSESERQLTRQVAEHRLAAVAFDTQVAIMITDADQRILRVNQAFSDITGYPPEEVLGQTPSLLSSGLQSRGFYAEMWAQLSRNGRWEGEMWNRRKNGEAYPEHLVISSVKNGEGEVEYYVANFGDLTSAKKAEERIHTLAYYDPLTQLANRRLLRDHISKAQSGRDGHKSHWALLFIDLDNFKALNDSLGLTVGDLALKRAAERLMAFTRDSDVVARPGGDEFALLIGSLNGDLEQAVRAAGEVAAKTLEQLRYPFYLEGSSWSLAASIGIVLFSGDEDDPDELIGCAEIAMYEAKRSGGDTWRFFDPQMQEEVQRRTRMEEDLRESVARQQLRLYYQVKVDQQGSITGCEGLLRWQHPERGLVRPDEFIPLAEHSGLIVPIGRWVIEEACRVLQRWSADPQRCHWSLAINISGRQLSSRDFVQEVGGILAEYGINMSGGANGHLQFEITESLLLEDLDMSVTVIRELNRLGIVFAMDDFGTGYSSLSYLKMLPLQLVKIDRSFVHDMLQDRGDAAIVEMVIALARTLDLRVVAEGVENVTQHRTLVGLGCDYLQGYLYSKPVPEEQLPDQGGIDAMALSGPSDSYAGAG